MPEKTAETFEGEWLRSDDLARKDEDGYYWYVGRADDVIISAGYRIGPSEVEDSLMKHDAVAEVGVIGVPDEERGQVVAAFVVPAPDVAPSEELAERIREDVKTRLSKHEYPRVVEFVEELPKTASEKIQRYKLEERYTADTETRGSQS
jgi:acetyl-CoA synthetase